MSFDQVHDSQAVHRALVQAFSFPGTPVPFPSVGTPTVRGMKSPMGALVKTLLDPETTFWCDQPNDVTEQTGAKNRPIGEAAFLLIPQGDEDLWSLAFRSAFRGTLADPHRGATVLVQASALSLGVTWLASGPGLEAPLALSLPGEGRWVAARNDCCAEFPLGVDLVWLRDDSMVALPRTTRLVRREA